MNRTKLGEPFELWHLRNACGENAAYAFMPHDFLHRLGGKVNISRYYRVFDAQIEKGATLEDIFKMFNANPPREYLARRLSVSDLIVYQGRVWYVDSFGFRDVTEEVGGLPEEENK